ncbi:VOC family protein [Micromonospora sp. NPDC023814]|uniref:VOC family protein n=1 Tax=Micromonospora sp. NPDC023814 TaxID=3154596 RepID=UPI0033FC32D7
MIEIQNVYPKLVVADAAAAIDFYRSAFGARETARYTDSAGKIVHAEVTIGSFTVGVKDEGYGDVAPTSLGGTPVMMALDVSDADATAEAAVNSGARVIYPVSDQPHGGRAGRVADPFGHQWIVSKRNQDLASAEVQERVAAM